MGMAAELIAIGPYSRAIMEYLDYSPIYYNDVPDGIIVTRRLFGIHEGSGLSTEFASFVGVSNPWDFRLHKIVNAKIDWKGLGDFGTQYEHYNDDVTALRRLCEAGFEFHFRPEG